HLSVAAMLVPTNDAFFAINGTQVLEGSETVVLMSPAYDTGTEANDELCRNIPGPPGVCMGEGFNASRVG
ncbi:MAG TPA: spondin domain-containing protein, partial [Bryobacteraceae bacterium]|nr:spondin domain-containing protein [Bryobacteraceae bacterium]